MQPDTFVNDFVLLHGFLPIAGAESADTSGGGTATATPDAGGDAAGQQGSDTNEGGGDRSAALDARMDDVIAELQNLGSRIPEPDRGPSPAELSTQRLLDELFPQGGDPADQTNGGDQQIDADNPNALAEQLSPLIQSQLRTALEPMLRQQEQARVEAEQERVQNETAGLFREYPQLANDSDYRAEILGEADQWARLAHVPAERAREPRFVELVHLASVGLKSLEGETPAGGGEAQVGLEGARGSRQASQVPTAEEQAQRMRSAGNGSNFFT